MRTLSNDEHWSMLIGVIAMAAAAIGNQLDKGVLVKQLVKLQRVALKAALEA